MPAGPSSTMSVLHNGSVLPDELKNLLVSAYVDNSLNVPDLFALTFTDPARKVLTDNGIKIGDKVTIKVISNDNPSGEILLDDAEVTALEAEWQGSSGAMTVVRGLDKSHRLFRGRTTKAYKNVMYSDVATQVASRNSLSPGQIDATGTVLDQVNQVNVSDWDFLSGLAREVGYELVVAAGKLDFKKQDPASSAPAAGDLNSTNPLQLVMGDDILRMRCSVTSAQQVDSVQVKGWDPKQKQAMTGNAPAKSSGVDIGVQPAELASKFGSPKHTTTNIPLSAQGELDAAAKAIAEEIGGGLATLEGVARGNLKLKAGAMISIGQVGAPFDGKYKLTTTRHNFDLEGYTTWFTVSGRKDSTTLYLASGMTAGAAGPNKPIPGVVQAIVTNVQDPLKEARVKVKFPWLDDSYETDWVRTVQLSAGNNYGSVVLPEVGDEVICAFEQGDLRRPYLLGGVYNGMDKPKAGTCDDVDGGGKVTRRDFYSRTGHTLSFTEDPAKSDGIIMKTGDDKILLNMDKKMKKVTLKMDSGEIEIDCTGAPGNITIKADQKMTLQANMIDIKAQAGITMDGGGGNVDIKGVQFSAQGTAGATVKGLELTLQADTQAALKGGAMVQVQGAIVQIN